MFEREDGLRPTTPVPEPAARAVGADDTSKPTRTILVVEDTDAIRTLMVRVLTKGGFRVLDAGSGADALRLLEKHGAGIDLLVTDLWLPGMDGRRLAAEVRGRQPAVPVLFVTGDPSQVINDPFLAKPFLPGHLLSVVHQALSAQADQRRAYRSDP